MYKPSLTHIKNTQIKILIFSTLIVLFSFMITASSEAQVSTKDYSIMNSTGTTITYLYISPADLDKFDENIMTSTSPFATGSSFDYKWMNYPNEQCVWDVKYTTLDGQNFYIYDVDLCQNSTLRLTNGEILIKEQTQPR